MSSWGTRYVVLFNMILTFFLTRHLSFCGRTVRYYLRLSSSKVNHLLFFLLDKQNKCVEMDMHLEGTAAWILKHWWNFIRCGCVPTTFVPLAATLKPCQSASTLWNRSMREWRACTALMFSVQAMTYIKCFISNRRHINLLDKCDGQERPIFDEAPTSCKKRRHEQREINKRAYSLMLILGHCHT